MNKEMNNKIVPKLRFPEFRASDGWELKTLGDVSTFFKGKGLPKSEIIPNGENYCIHYGELFTEYLEVISEVRSRTNLKNGFTSLENDVLMPTSDVTPNGLAKASCVKQSGVILGGDILIIRTDSSKINGEFLSRFIRKNEQRVLRLVSGSTVFHLYASSFEKFEVALPKDISEQNKIADCLSSLDELIGAENRQLEARKAHKKGLMQQLFTAEGETVPTLRFPEFRDSGEWEEKKLEEIARRGSGHTPNKSKPENYNGGIKWVSLADSKRLDHGLITETAIEISMEGIKNSSAVLHPAGTVLISRDAGIGKSAVMGDSMAVSQHFIVWTCSYESLNNWFFYHLLQKSKQMFEMAAIGSTIKTIGLQFFKNLALVIPSFVEQQKIADCLSSLDELITAQTEKIAQLKLHKKGLMQELFPQTN